MVGIPVHIRESSFPYLTTFIIEIWVVLSLPLAPIVAKVNQPLATRMGSSVHMTRKRILKQGHCQKRSRTVSRWDRAGTCILRCHEAIWLPHRGYDLRCGLREGLRLINNCHCCADALRQLGGTSGVGWFGLLRSLRRLRKLDDYLPGLPPEGGQTE